MTSLRCFFTTAFAVLPPSIAAMTASVSVLPDASSAAGSIGGFGKCTGLPPTPFATLCAVLANVLGSRELKPVTALSDAGFLVVGADGGVDVVVDAGAAAGVVDGVEAVVLGSVVDMGHLPLNWGTLTVLPPDRHSGDV